jgi:hypothetical protein
VYLRDNANVRERVERELREKLGLPTLVREEKKEPAPEPPKKKQP